MIQKLLFAAAFLSMASAPVLAQDENAKSNILDKGKTLAEKLSYSSKFDPTYVVAPEKKWIVFTSGNASYDKFNMDVPIPMLQSVREAIDNHTVNKLYPDYKSFTDYKFRLHQGTQSMALGIGYGNIRASYAYSIGNHKSTTFNFEALGRVVGGFIDYRHTKEMRGTMYDARTAMMQYRDDRIDISNNETPYYNYTVPQFIDKNTNDITSDRNDYTTLHIQAHYIFNNRRFAYSAAKGAAQIQKKSAGSPIVLADYYQSKAKFDDCLMWGLNETFKTWKVSVGGGYAYNYTPNGGKVLLHASVIPTISLYSKANYRTHLATFEEWAKVLYEGINDEPMPYKTMEEFKQKEPELYEKWHSDYDSDYTEGDADNMFANAKNAKKQIEGTHKVTLNCTARLSATWNINDNFVLGAYGTYQYSNYANKNDYTIKEHNIAGQVFFGYRW